MSTNRNARRLAAKTGKKMLVENGPEYRKTLMVFFATQMAENGAGLLDLVRQQVAPAAVTSGHVVDALMTCAAAMEKAMAVGNAEDFTAAATSVLFFARDIAIREGKIKVVEQAPVAKA